MYSESFEYFRPKTLAEAAKLLKKHKGARLLAGGHSLLPAMKFRLATARALVDLGAVKGLSGIKSKGKTLEIGATTTHAEIAASSLVKKSCPILAEAAEQIGDIQVRNRGTIGGSIAHADPAADQPATLIALGAEMVCEGPKGRRTVKVDDWFQGLMSTALHEDEILVELRVPAWPAGTGGAYLKFPHPASRFAVVGVAAMVTLDKEGKCTKVGVGVTGAGTKAVRSKGVEAGVTGKKLDAATIEAAAQKGAEGVDVQADLQGSVEYKSHLCRVFAKRALTEAVKRARA
jgi:aerobic carbon-monoxide dehydrogenase medium subunit